MTISISECRAAGMIFEAHEAVAITQQLIASLREPRSSDELRAPFGPPTADNVFLGEEGSVVCRGCGVTPAVSEMGIFLDELLPAGSPRVPGGLRYTIARALLNVDVPPFDSLDDLSSDLSRHERGDRADIVRRTLERASRPRLIGPAPFVERRRNHAPATMLRRELREADMRLYQQRAGLIAEPAVIDLVAAAPAPAKGRPLTATAACLAAGFSIIAAGEIMYSRHQPAAALPTPVVVARTAPNQVQPVPTVMHPAADEARRVEAIGSPPQGIIAVRNVSSPSKRISRPDSPRIAAKRTSPPAAVTARRRPAARPASRGVFDRLRLGWLKNAFTSRSKL